MAGRNSRQHIDRGRGGRSLRLVAAAAAACVALGVLAGVAGAGDTPNARKQAIRIARAYERQAAIEADAQQYVGTVEGTNAYIALVVNNGDVEIYVCDGAGVIAWPQGKVKKNGSFSAESASGVKVTGEITDSNATGTVTLTDGTEHAFSADVAVSPAGLYERRTAPDASGEAVVAATIVLADGTQRGGNARAFQICARIKLSAQEYLASAEAAGDFDEHQSNMDGFHRQTANYLNRGCTELTGSIVTS